MARPPSTTEAQFHADVERTLRAFGYLCFSVRNSHRRVSERGFPDIVAVHPRSGALVVFELKRDKRARVHPEQHAWLAALARRADVCGVLTPDGANDALARAAELAGFHVVGRPA